MSQEETEEPRLQVFHPLLLSWDNSPLLQTDPIDWFSALQDLFPSFWATPSMCSAVWDQTH